MTADCVLIIPCRDEAAALQRLLPRVPSQLSVLVVDNGSRDQTADVARRAGARVVQESQAGYGAAVHAGVAAVSADIVAVMDGDGTFDPCDLTPLIEDVANGGCTLAVGRRMPVTPGLVPWHARVGNRLVLGALRRKGLLLHDVPPVRVCRRVDLLEMGVTDRRFGYPVELLRRAAKAGWVVHEYPVRYCARTAGTRSKVSGNWRGTALAAVDVVRALS